MLVYALGTAQWIYKMLIKTAIWNGLDASRLPFVAIVKVSPPQPSRTQRRVCRWGRSRSYRLAGSKLSNTEPRGLFP